MKKLFSALTQWLEKTIRIKAEFYAIVISHIVFGVLLFFELKDDLPLLKGITIAAIILVPLLYLFTLRKIAGELKDIKK